MPRNDQITRQWHLLRRLEAPRARDAITRREVDPYRLRYVGGALYLIAYDHRRRDVRQFAVERIRTMTLTDHPFQMPLGFDRTPMFKTPWSSCAASRSR